MTTRQQYICASSSSSSNIASLKKYDVFISFRGKDTRRNFTSHLYEALSKNVITFIDDNELEKGDEISSALINAIEESEASVIIFSEDYASSKWCLNELVKILECKRDQGQIVIPVFYEIEPTDVGNQRGSYKEAFETHERNLIHDKDKLEKWKQALKEASKLCGWNSQKCSKESDFIKDIVKNVLEQLNDRHPIEVDTELVGIEEKFKEVVSLLDLSSNDVRKVGLWGMGGIGKSTLAKYLYAKLSSQFDRRCFFENIWEESSRSGLVFVRNKLLSTLLEIGLEEVCVESPIFKRRRAVAKSLIVLDGVETIEQAECVNIVNKYLGPGSRLIITARDIQIFSQFRDCDIYEVKRLNECESFQLFCWNAFEEKLPKDGYRYLSVMAVHYCNGNPLALKILGSHLRTKSKEVWKSELEKLQKIPNTRIFDVLKLSFDDLDRTQKDIFLDIASISLENLAYYNYRDHKYYLKDVLNACNFFAESGLQVLRDKALIYFDSDNIHIRMHGLLQEMGKEIVKNESAKHPGRRSRLWDHNDLYDVLRCNKGTEDVEVIEFRVFKFEDLYLSSDSFKSMTNLRYLHINMGPENKLYLLKGLDWMSDKLRYLYWLSCPLESLPSTFCAKWLVQLTMKNSKLKKLWDGILRLDNLMILDLEGSKDLIEIPDLSRAPNLELVYLSDCESLCQLHPSIFSTPKLKELELNGCTKIQSLKTNIHSKSLRILSLMQCSSLVEFSVTSEEMTELGLRGTAVHEFPSSMWSNSKLTMLHLHGCEKLNIVGKKLPNDTGLGFLKKLWLSGCTQINTLNLMFILDGTPSLEVLYMRGCCNLETLPDNIQNNSMLRTLELDECSKLKSIPKLPPFLLTLQLDECRKLESLPKLPDTLQTLQLGECWKLKSLPKLPATLKRLTATNCIYLNTNAIHRPTVENMIHRLHTNFGNKNHCYSEFYFFPGAKVPSEFDFQTTEASIVIPPIPKSGLWCFIYCIILSSDIYDCNIRTGDDFYIYCTIYEHNKKVMTRYVSCDKEWTLLSDHVFIRCGYDNSELAKVENENGGDHYNLSFEFKYYDYNEEVMSTKKAIKGCGVIPVYGLVLDGKSNSKDEKVELQPNAEVSDDSNQHPTFDIDELQPNAEVSDDSDQHPTFDIDELQPNAEVSDDADPHPTFDIDELQPNAEVSDDSDQHPTFDIDELQPNAEVSDDSDPHPTFDIDELQPNAEVSHDSDQHPTFDIDELQPQPMGTDVRCSPDKNEDDKQQLLIPLTEDGDKSSCTCSIGLLLKHMLEESKRLFLWFLN